MNKRKKALVIGTSLGIAEHLIKENYYVHVISLEGITNSKYLKSYKGDITKWDILKDILENISNLDCIVFAQRYRGEDSNIDYDVMIYAPNLIIDYLDSKNKLNEFCSIIFMNSDASYNITNQNIMYHITRAGIVQMTKFYAQFLANTHTKIRVNSISPCKINKGYINNYFINKVPLRRMCEKQDIYDTIDYLNKCKFITGQNIILDGGSSLSLRLYDKGDWKKI